jgi:hypothetical protein
MALSQRPEKEFPIFEFSLSRWDYYYVLNSVFGGAEIHDTDGILHESMYGVPRSNDSLSLYEINKKCVSLSSRLPPRGRSNP